MDVAIPGAGPPAPCMYSHHPQRGPRMVQMWPICQCGRLRPEGTTPSGPRMCLAVLHGEGGRSIIQQRDKQVILIQCIPSTSLTVFQGTIVYESQQPLGVIILHFANAGPTIGWLPGPPFGLLDHWTGEKPEDVRGRLVPFCRVSRHLNSGPW